MLAWDNQGQASVARRPPGTVFQALSWPIRLRPDMAAFQERDQYCRDTNQLAARSKEIGGASNHGICPNYACYGEMSRAESICAFGRAHLRTAPVELWMKPKGVEVPVVLIQPDTGDGVPSPWGEGQGEGGLLHPLHLPSWCFCLVVRLVVQWGQCPVAPAQNFHVAKRLTPALSNVEIQPSFPTRNAR